MSDGSLASLATKAAAAGLLLFLAGLARSFTAAHLANGSRAAGLAGTIGSTPGKEAAREARLSGALVWAALLAPALLLIVEVARDLVPFAGTAGALAVAAFAALVIGTALPARIGERHAEGLVRHAAPLMKGLSLPLRPFISHLIRRRADLPVVEPAAEEEKLLTRLLEATGDSDAKEEAENALVRQLLGRVLHMRETAVASVMSPRSEIAWIGQREGSAAAARVMREARHGRLPVCGRDLDDVVGIVHIKDVFLARHGVAAGSTMGAIGRQPSFVDGQLPLTALLARWRHGGGTMSVVRDRGGRVIGLVTLSDVLDWLLEAKAGEEAVVPNGGGGAG